MSFLWLLDQKHTADCILETGRAKVSVKRSKRQWENMRRQRKILRVKGEIGAKKNKVSKGTERMKGHVLTVSLASWNCDQSHPGHKNRHYTFIYNCSNIFTGFQTLKFTNRNPFCLWNTKGFFFLSTQLKSVGSNVVLDPINFHCTDQNSFKTFFKISFVFHKKKNNAGLEQHGSEIIIEFLFLSELSPQVQQKYYNFLDVQKIPSIDDSYLLCNVRVTCHRIQGEAS